MQIMLRLNQHLFVHIMPTIVAASSAAKFNITRINVAQWHVEAAS